ncbi:MAG: hypothetical protein ACI837_000294 [Crocinitomicaceae bacterium]|jgi:hypothetical protein
MKKITLLLILSITITAINAQTPGGTSQAVSVWIKANNGTTPSVGSGPLTSWTNAGVAGVVTVNGAPTFEELGYNYNPKVHFNGDGNFLAHAGIIFGSIYAVVEMENLSRSYTHLSTWTNMCTGPHSDGTLHGGMNTGITAYELTGYCPEFEGAGVWKRNSLSTGHTNVYTGAHELISAVANSGDLDAYGDRLLGGQPCLPSRDWLGDASEVVVLTGPSTPAQRNQIESYLAIKYGITLNNSGGGTQGDYVSTTGTTIWNASNSPSYHNNVIGIGREDSELLYQRQSHTVNDTTRIYVSALAATNASNGGVFNDFSYILVGENQGKMCSTTASNAEVPGTCGLYSRLEREWKVSRTSLGNDFNFDAKLNPCGLPASVTVSDLRLLVDDDGDFSNGGTTCYFNGDGSGIVISYSNPVITVSNISNAMIPNNNTRFMTIASINQATPLPVELANYKAECNDGRVELEWETLSEYANDYFTLEESRDGFNFVTRATIPGNGTSSSVHSYSWVDENQLSGTAYYRLSQTDYDGNSESFQTLSVNCQAFKDFLISPNPFEHEFTITATMGGTVTLHDVTGKITMSQTFGAGKNLLEASQLATGTYIARIELENGNIQLQKLVKY